MEAITQKQGCPHLVRGYMGNENGHIAQMQDFFTGRKESFIYGKSTGNQGIEMFWYFFRRQCSQIWIETLLILKNDGQFTGSFIDVNLMQFCFLNLVPV